ncbi:hypothetical protein CCP3SC5AM1_880012 [Gammaproteobacteria bacterium]
MDNKAFYQGLLCELEKNAATVPKVGAGAGTTPTSNAGGGSASTGVKTPTVDKPTTPAAPIAPWQKNYANQSFLGGLVRDTATSTAGPILRAASHVPLLNKILPDPRQMVKDRVQNLKPGEAPQELSDLEASFLNQNKYLQDQLKTSLADKGVERINNTGVGDVLGSIDKDISPQEKMWREWGMSEPEIANKWQGAMADKSYGAASLDSQGNPKVGGKGRLQVGNFLKDHWGKLLLALLGVGGAGWLLSGKEQAPAPTTTVNNYVNQPAPQLPQKSVVPSFF